MSTTTTRNQIGSAKIIGPFAIMVGAVDVTNDSPSPGVPSRVWDGTSNPVSWTSPPPGQRGSAQLDLIVYPSDTFTPLIGDQVYIFNFGSREFAGTVDTIQRTWLGEDGYAVWHLSCVSLEQQFDSVLIYPGTAVLNATAGVTLTQFFSSYYRGPVRLGVIMPGVVIPIIVACGDRLSDIFTQLATACGFVWGVDPTDLTLYFRDVTGSPAPFQLATTDILWETAQWSQTRADFRDRQLIRMAFAQNPPSNVLLPGDSATKIFTIPYQPAQVVQVNLTTSTQATATCTFTGQPAAGDYTVIGTGIAAARYTFVATLDNTIPWQVLIGASTAASCQHLADAINANPLTLGIAFSLPTPENPALNAGDLSGTAFPVVTKTPGSGKSLVEVTSSSAFSWGSVSDGTDGTTEAALSQGTDYTWPVVT